MNEILLDGKKFDFREKDLPLLIHGEDKAGGSLFTVSVVANLFKDGSKLLCLSGYHMAKDEFYKQTNSSPQDKKVIFCLQEQVENFINYINTLDDIEERIILIKNIDLFDEQIFDLISNKQKIIVSGDITKCAFKDKILNQDFKTKVLFSKLEGVKIPELEKYKGFISEDNLTGIVNIKFNN